MNEEKIIKILKEIRPEVENFSEVKLIDDGIIDSFDIVSLLLELNERFQIDIGVEQILPENFNTVADIKKLVEKAMENKY